MSSFFFSQSDVNNPRIPTNLKPELSLSLSFFVKLVSITTLADPVEIATKQKEFIYRLKLPDIYILNHLPLHSYFFKNISQFGSQPCLINSVTGETYTYTEVELMSKKVAAGLDKLGIQQGQVIILLLPNSPEFVFTFLDASYHDATNTTTNPFYTLVDIAKQAKASNARLIITQACHVEKLREFSKENDVKIMTTDSPSNGCLHFFELTHFDESEMPMVKIHPDDVVILPYSSRITGLLKGVMLTQRGVITSVAQ
uniref:4-coumarate--CoA ligase n=1 Tax=Nelumbo nucifera TaxID=4432 RepID=A0A822XZ48_NELNU|nr:TPA_asm: hypothetical protein HUJ06_025729 [Nelumbo nucifera]